MNRVWVLIPPASRCHWVRLAKYLNMYMNVIEDGTTTNESGVTTTRLTLDLSARHNGSIDGPRTEINICAPLFVSPRLIGGGKRVHTNIIT